MSAETEALRELTAAIVVAYIGNNHVTRDELPKLIPMVYQTLASLGTEAKAAAPIEPVLIPAVPIRKSVTPDYLVCLEDGKHYQSLKRPLAQYGLTPDEYRRKWKLPPDYPMVAPNYAARRSELARAIGLGRKPGQRAETPEVPKTRSSKRAAKA